MFDHEKLDVYGMELQFIGWVTPLLEEASAASKGRTREVCDQLDRASLSTLLNTAEGNGKRQRQVRAKFFDDARGSATECAACLDALVAKMWQIRSELLLANKCWSGLFPCCADWLTGLTPQTLCTTRIKK